MRWIATTSIEYAFKPYVQTQNFTYLSGVYVVEMHCEFGPAVELQFDLTSFFVLILNG